ncbi:predicted protein [Histoplasma capsulatum var. duboisii H88]|uniref:Predicted protein n=1 Tax=Ajellomyces capsulatus (strain H88) TaxID=544711 RepID=F0UMZ7_AJEC8|nr:predicted protein [Histoplasma capsulatum var. duboisii H88]
MDKTFPDQSSRQYFQGLGILDISTAIGPTRHVLVVRPVGGYIKDQNDKQGSPIFSFGRQTNIDHLGDKARSSASETPAGMPPQPPVVPVPPEKNKIQFPELNVHSRLFWNWEAVCPHKKIRCQTR